MVLSSLANLSKKFNTLETSLSDKIDVTNQNLTSITQEIQAAKEDRLNIHKTVDELKLDVQTLKAQPLPPNIAEIMEKMKTEMRADIMKEVKDEMNTIRETQHKNQLMEEIRRHDPGMIVFGYLWPNGVSVDQVRGLLRNQLQYGNRADVTTIKSATLLSPGRGVNAKPTVLVMFGSVGERDECLRQSFHLAGSSISFIKYMPKCYEQQYRKFREKAKNLRTAMNVSTYIGFEKHELVLKQKQKDTVTQKFGWVVFDKWQPQASENLQVHHQSSASTTSSSPAIAVDALANTVFIHGVKTEISSQETEKQVLAELIEPEDKQLLEKVVAPKNGIVILYIKSGTDGKALCLKYDGKEYKGTKRKVSQG